jgi:hypothetical protein
MNTQRMTTQCGKFLTQLGNDSGSLTYTVLLAHISILLPI